jgi:hypothetical protein
MNTRPTPETDELVRTQLERVGITLQVLASKLTLKCESLECERDEARFDLDFRRRLGDWQNKTIDDLTAQRDEARAESIRWQSIAEGRGRTDDEGESDCSVCGGCFMIPGTEPNDDVMNTPCPKCNGHLEL